MEQKRVGGEIENEYKFIFIFSKFSQNCTNVKNIIETKNLYTILKSIEYLYCDNIYIREKIMMSELRITTVPCVLEINMKEKSVNKIEGEQFYQWFNNIVESIDEYENQLYSNIYDTVKNEEEQKLNQQRMEMERKRRELENKKRQQKEQEENFTVSPDWKPQSLINVPHSNKNIINPTNEDTSDYQITSNSNDEEEYQEVYLGNTNIPIIDNNISVGGVGDEEDESYANEVYSLQDRKIGIDTNNKQIPAGIERIVPEKQNKIKPKNNIDIMKLATEMEKQRELADKSQSQ